MAARSAAAAAKTTPEQADLTGEQEATLERLAEGLKGKGLYAKIAWVQQHVGAVDKTGQVSFGKTNFKHMQEHGLIQVLRPLLRIAGLATIPGGITEGSGRQDGNVYTVDLALTVIDTENGEAITRFYPNVGVDTADKGFNKAYTGAVKYALQKFFLVPTEGIDDNETVDITTVRAGNTAAEVRDITSAKPSKKDIADLRAVLVESKFDGPKLKNWMTAELGVSKIDDVRTKADFARLGEWVQGEIAAS